MSSLNIIHDLRSYTTVPSPAYYTHTQSTSYDRVFLFFPTTSLLSILYLHNTQITRWAQHHEWLPLIRWCALPRLFHTCPAIFMVCTFVSTHRRWMPIVYLSNHSLVIIIISTMWMTTVHLMLCPTLLPPHTIFASSFSTLVSLLTCTSLLKSYLS